MKGVQRPFRVRFARLGLQPQGGTPQQQTRKNKSKDKDIGGLVQGGEPEKQ
jgi:hypothetical protein